MIKTVHIISTKIAKADSVVMQTAKQTSTNPLLMCTYVNSVILWKLKPALSTCFRRGNPYTLLQLLFSRLWYLFFQLKYFIFFSSLSPFSHQSSHGLFLANSWESQINGASKKKPQNKKHYNDFYCFAIIQKSNFKMSCLLKLLLPPSST